MTFRKISLLCLLLLAPSGCALFPEVIHKPVIQNPFPQLSKVAVTQFINHSGEPTADMTKIADSYASELGQFPGFEVLPVRLVEAAIHDHRIDLRNPEERRRLMNMLGVDALVVGSVTDYTPYYPPRMGIVVNWYAANPCFHPIPPGYGLPWGTTEEEFIPDNLVYEAEMALAKAQLATQTPLAPMAMAPPRLEQPPRAAEEIQPPPSGAGTGAQHSTSNVVPASHAEPTLATLPDGTIASNESGSQLPADWPDPKGFLPPPPQANPPACRPTNEPVMRHARVYSGKDADFTAALESYYRIQNDARYDGWQGYLQRSDDFIHFCCHKHIAEMLTARGGAGESQVVYRWRKDR